MEVLRAIRQRRSVRTFSRKPLPPAAVEALIDALRWAPSAGNLQSRRFYFVFQEAARERLAHFALNQSFVAEAPLAVVACADRGIRAEYGTRGVNLYCLLDVAAAVENLMLAAEAKGLATCWVGALREAAVRRLLELPSNLRPVSIIPVGYPGESPAPPRRLPRRQVVKFLR